MKNKFEKIKENPFNLIISRSFLPPRSRALSPFLSIRFAGSGNLPVNSIWKMDAVRSCMACGKWTKSSPWKSRVIGQIAASNSRNGSSRSAWPSVTAATAKFAWNGQQLGEFVWFLIFWRFFAFFLTTTFQSGLLNYECLVSFDSPWSTLSNYIKIWHFIDFSPSYGQKKQLDQGSRFSGHNLTRNQSIMEIMVTFERMDQKQSNALPNLAYLTLSPRELWSSKCKNPFTNFCKFF